MAALSGALLAQTIEGTWQGTLTPPNQNGGIRLVFKIDKNGDRYQGRFYNLENGRQFNLGTITLHGNAGFNVTGTEMRARNISLAGLIAFAYVLHRSQISGLPGWAETEGYEIVARLPQGGDPTDPQLLAMLQHLIRSRFNLSFHTEK